MNDNDKIENCVNYSNGIRSKFGLKENLFDKKSQTEFKKFSDLWYAYGLTELNEENDNISLNDKIDCLDFWFNQLFDNNPFDANYLHRKILNSQDTEFVLSNPDWTTSKSKVILKIGNQNYTVYPVDLVPLEIDKQVQDFKSPLKIEVDSIKFNEYIETADKNLSYGNDSADEVALKYYKMALEINPTDTEVRQLYQTLDKIVNHKNYKYSINDEQTIELMKIFVDCCNVKEFERLHKIISDDFVCISRYFGRTKKAFIDSVYFERKSLMGLWTEIFQYENNDRKIPCIKLNDFGVLFFNIENDKIIRAFEYKIDDKLDRNKLVRWTE